MLIFNIKRLAAEAKREARSRESAYQSSPSPRGRRSPFGGAPVDTEPQGGGGAADGEVRGHRRTPSGGVLGSVPSDIAACQSALSFMCCWGVDASFDAQCRDEIGLQPPPTPVTYGVRGHGGNFSFLTPKAQLAHHRWQCSSHLTALHSIAAVSLANTLMSSPGNDEVRNVCSSLVTHFSVMLPERLPSFCAPSLSLLARHYVDSVEEVQQAARALMEGTIHRMPAQTRAQIVAAWSPRVMRLGASAAAAAAASDLSSPQGVSVLVLAVLASRFGTLIEPGVCTVLVAQLVALLDHPAELHRSAAAELVGKGYTAWRAYIADPPSVIRTLFKLSAAHARSQAGGGDTGGETVAGGGRAAADEGGGGSTHGGLPALNRFQAALLAVGTIEPRHFCRAMGEMAAHMGSTSAARVAAVHAVIALVKARGTSLEADLPIVVQAVLRPLDPSVPSLREGCLIASTTALRELVKRYPMMSFHQGTQRLAIGTVEGVVLIYDLRTATKWRILHGHEAAVSALAFSSSGEHLASLAVGEKSIRWWLAGSQGLFGFLGLQGLCLHVSPVEQQLTAEDGTPSPAVGIEWTGVHSVALTMNRKAVGAYSRPASQ